MAVVRPFRAVTFSLANGPEVTAHTAPPYDVVTPEQRDRMLAAEPENVVALELPDGSREPSLPCNRYENSSRTWRSWLNSGVLVTADKESVYVLEQCFTIGDRDVCRKAFVAAIDLEQFSSGVVLPHERTLPRAIDDRLNLLRATHANLSQVLGLYSDPDRVTDPLLDTSLLGDPLMEATDADGVESRVWALPDEETTRAVARALAEKPIFIADGHHRYATALKYREERRASGSEGQEHRWEPYDAVMMALVNMDDPELVVLPTHRIATVPDDFDVEAFWASLERDFDVLASPAQDVLAVLSDADARATFVIKVDGSPPRAIRLKPDVDLTAAVPGAASDAWKTLDVAVLQELVLAPLFGIHPDRPETLEKLRFCKEAGDALRVTGPAEIAFLLRPTRVDQLREVALSGEMMPQKSTYFYPKLLSGLLMRSLDY